MENQLLKDPTTGPGDEILQNPLYTAMTEGLRPEWRYYNDGKAWLAKVGDGRRTIFWFSVWEGWFQASFFFLERHLEGLAALGLEHGRMEKEFGKMIPLIFKVPTARDPADTSARIATPTIAEIRRTADFKKKG
jgi:hypothetical protein